MNLRFDARGRPLWEIATAVAWRIDPERPLLAELIADEYIHEHIENVFIQNPHAAYAPPRIQHPLNELGREFPEAHRDLTTVILAEHIFAALSPEIAETVQHPERAPFLVFDPDSKDDSLFVDIDKILYEYENVYKKTFGSKRRREDAIRNVIKSSVTPRFDKLEIGLEKLDKTLHAGFEKSATSEELTRRFDELIKEIKKPRPSEP